MLRLLLHGQVHLSQYTNLLRLQQVLQLHLQLRHRLRYETSFIAAGIVEQFGRFTRLMQSGFNYKNPCSEEVVEVDMRMKTVLLGKQTVMTKDNIQLTVDAIVYYRVINPLKVKYLLGLASIYNAVR